MNDIFDGFKSIDRTQIQIDGGNVKMNSYVGVQKDVSAALKQALKQGKLDPANIFLAGISKDGTRLHMGIVLIKDGTESIGDVAVTLSKKSVQALHLSGFDYLSFIATMQDGVNVAAFDEGFVPNDATGKAYGNFASAVLDGDNERIRGATSKTRTLLLLGRQIARRVLTATRYGHKGKLSILISPVDGGQKQEFGIVGGHTVLAALPDGGRIHACNVQEIARMFTASQNPQWQKQNTGVRKIEGISLPIDGQPNVILTAINKGGERTFIPATISWDKQGGRYTNFHITLQTKDALDTTTLGSWTPAPLRVSERTDIVIGRDSNGGANLLGVRTIRSYAPNSTRFGDMVHKAASDAYASAPQGT